MRSTSTAALAAAARETLDELSPHDVFARRLAQEELADELKLALEARYQTVLTRLQDGEALS